MKRRPIYEDKERASKEVYHDKHAFTVLENDDDDDDMRTQTKDSSIVLLMRVLLRGATVARNPVRGLIILREIRQVGVAIFSMRMLFLG